MDLLAIFNSLLKAASRMRLADKRRLPIEVTNFLRAIGGIISIIGFVYAYVILARFIIAYKKDPNIPTLNIWYLCFFLVFAFLGFIFGLTYIISLIDYFFKITISNNWLIWLSVIIFIINSILVIFIHNMQSKQPQPISSTNNQK